MLAAEPFRTAISRNPEELMIASGVADLTDA